MEVRYDALIRESMNQRYKIYRRHRGVFYLRDTKTNERESLRTKDREEAVRLCNARNDAVQRTGLNLQLARVYFMASDAGASERTWTHVLHQIILTKQGETRSRWEVAAKDKALQPLLGSKLIETTAEHFIAALTAGTVSTNVFLRRIHNFALDLNWLLAPILPKRQWPAVRYQVKRAITWDEHLRIIDREGNPEKRAFYELLWNLGGSQGDIASLRTEDIDWENNLITFQRKKLLHREGGAVRISFGNYLRYILKSLPSHGLLFPYLESIRSSDRATEFK